MGHDERWGRIGGHVVLDLADTISWRYDDVRRVDLTPDFATLSRWAADRRLIDARETHTLQHQNAGDDAQRATVRIHRLRDSVLLALETGQLDGDTVMRDELREALAHAEPAPGLPLSWTVAVREPQDLARRLALVCTGFLSQPHRNVRVCEGPGCGWFFLDTSRNHSRRWCDPQDCGNRVRVARHASARRRNAQT